MGPPGKQAAQSSREDSSDVGDAEAAVVDLRASELYLNRELTWLSFNRRVLGEAQDPRVPLLERVKFLAITGSNLDEFFMKRIGGLKRQVAAGVHERTVDGRTATEQITEAYAEIRSVELEQRALVTELTSLLGKAGIEICSCRELSPAERKWARNHYFENVFPLVTPQAIDPAHPFPFVSNLSINLLVTVRYSNETEISVARVKVPVGGGIPRFIRLRNSYRFVLLEDVMSDNLDLLFPRMDIVSSELFRVTRNANSERDEEEAYDLLELIESEVRERRFAPFVRVETMAGMDGFRRARLVAELGLDESSDLFEVEGMMAMRDLMELVALDKPNLKDPPHRPLDHPRLVEQRSIFHITREGESILLSHPFESFSTSVERFLSEAASDPKVRAIKMTLYRTASDSLIIKRLIEAARNGKQVAVVVELKARFDEAANIKWANRLEEVGIHVTYGVVGLKTHCKTILVVRRDYDGLRRYAHIGTGNYHSGTARLYTDLGLITCDPDICHDLTELFNYLTTGYTPGRDYRKLLVAPKRLKRALVGKIEREIARHVNDGKGLIQFKCNALEDVDVCRALYRASMAGVKIELIVRDTCRLRPGMPGLSENITVRSIVGRFLEHSRVFYFRNGGSEEYYIGSADVMQRNLLSRVEVVVPVEGLSLRKDLRGLLDLYLADDRQAWLMASDGTYERCRPGDSESPRSAQVQQIEKAERRLRLATRLRRRKPKGFDKRNLNEPQ